MTGPRKVFICFSRCQILQYSAILVANLLSKATRGDKALSPSALVLLRGLSGALVATSSAMAMLLEPEYSRPGHSSSYSSKYAESVNQCESSSPHYLTLFRHILSNWPTLAQMSLLLSVLSLRQHIE
jgi:hypothetical protein